MKSLLLSTYPIPANQAILEPRNSANSWIHTELAQLGESLIARYSDLEFMLQESEAEISVNDHDLKDFDLFLFRSVTYKKHQLDNSFLLSPLSHLLNSWGKRILNGRHFIKFGHRFDKLFQMSYLADHDLPIPKTFYSSKGKEVVDNLPLISKPLVGSKGQGIVKLNELDHVTEKEVILQELQPGKSDYRVIVLGNSCLGAMKRTAKEGSIVSNFSAGGSVSQVELEKEMVDISLAAADLFRLEFCGVDLMKSDDGKYKIIEVNRFPDFIGFNQANKTKVQKDLVKYLANTTKK